MMFANPGWNQTPLRGHQDLPGVESTGLKVSFIQESRTGNEWMPEEAGWRLTGGQRASPLRDLEAFLERAEITGGGICWNHRSRIAGRQFSGQGKTEKAKQQFAEDVQFVLTPSCFRKENHTR